MKQNIQQDLKLMHRQEQALRFSQFDAAIAWELGLQLRSRAEQRQQAIAIEICLNAQQLFFSAMPNTTPDNAEWLRRKRNVVQRFHRSSYAVGLSLAEQETSLTEKYGLPVLDYAAHGGCFPIWVQRAMVGTIGVSGLPQREDHALVVRVLAEYLGHSLAELALAP